jgi:hypothetical protein
MQQASIQRIQAAYTDDNAGLFAAKMTSKETFDSSKEVINLDEFLEKVRLLIVDLKSKKRQF